MRPTNSKITPFGKPQVVSKFGSERLNAKDLPPVAMRELVMLAPDGKVRLFSSTFGDDQADSATRLALNRGFTELLDAGWIAISNNTPRIPTVTFTQGYDMSVRQLAPFRLVLGRYISNLALIIVRGYNPDSKSYTDTGQFRTVWAAEMSVRGG